VVGEEGWLFSKLVVTIVWFLAVGAAVLSLRHARLEAVHDLANTQRRVLNADRELWKLRAGVAELAEPGRVRRLAEGLGPLVHVIEAPVVAPIRAPYIEPLAELHIASAGAVAGDVAGGVVDGVDEDLGGFVDDWHVEHETGILVITADDALAVLNRLRASEGVQPSGRPVDAPGHGGQKSTDSGSGSTGVVR